MSKNTVKLGIAGLTAAATGAALFTAKKVNDKKKEEEKSEMAWWLSWLERRPVTAEVVGSIPIRVALKSLRKQAFFVYKISSSYKRCRIPDIEKSLKDGILLNR